MYNLVVSTLSLFRLGLLVFGALTVFICLLSCGADDIEDNGSVADSHLNGNNQTPVVTIKELQIKKGGEVQWRLNASPKPKTDIAVRVSITRYSYWVIIPKSSNHSETFNNEVFHGKIQIHPLPMISIVGKGLVVDSEKLRLPAKALGNHVIPKGYEFPLYNVGKPSVISVVAPEASYIGSSPADGRRIPANGTLKIFFNSRAANVVVNGKYATVLGKTASISGSACGIKTVITWDNGPGGNPGKVTINLEVLPTDTNAPRLRRVQVPLNHGRVIIWFNEAIAESGLKLTLENGNDEGWESEIDEDSVILQSHNGKKLRNRTTYIIKGLVTDLAGNQTSVVHAFTTK